MWRYTLPLILLAGLMGVAWYGLHSNPKYIPSPLIGKHVPAFSLPGLKHPSKKITDKVFDGEVSLFNVWGTWCFECKAEYPVLMQFSKRYNVPLYGLDYRDSRSKALGWLRTKGNPYDKIAFDKTGTAAINWGVYGAPETYIVDAHGIIRHKYIGPLTHELIKNDLMPRIEKLRAEQ